MRFDGHHVLSWPFGFLFPFERKYALPVFLHVDNGPAFGLGGVKRLVEFADGGFAVVGPFSFGIGAVHDQGEVNAATLVTLSTKVTIAVLDAVSFHEGSGLPPISASADTGKSIGRTGRAAMADSILRRLVSKSLLLVSILNAFHEGLNDRRFSACVGRYDVTSCDGRSGSAVTMRSTSLSHLPPPLAPLWTICSALSMLSDPPTWLGGYSLNVRRNRPTMLTPGTIVQSLSPHQRAYIIDSS